MFICIPNDQPRFSNALYEDSFSFQIYPRIAANSGISLVVEETWLWETAYKYSQQQN
jgi:hypothetical protein